MLALFASWALAQTPVVHLDELPSSDAIEAVAALSGLPPSQLDSLPMGEVLASPPALLGAGSLRRCARPPSTLDDVRAEIGRARRALIAEDITDTQNRLDAAVTMLGCIEEVADAAVGAELYLLRGAVHAWLDQLEDAHYEYLTAFAFDRALAWDESLPEAGRLSFEAARSAVPEGVVHFLPGKPVSGPWLDGALTHEPTPAAKSLHLAQVATGTGVQTAWLVVAGEATVVVPGSFRTNAIEAIGRGSEPAGFSRLLAATIPDFQAAYVVHQGGVWLLLREGSDLVVSELAPRVEVAAPVPLTRRERRQLRREARRQR